MDDSEKFNQTLHEKEDFCSQLKIEDITHMQKEFVMI